MRSANSFANKITSWELLATSIQPLLPEMPFLQAFYNQLQGLIVLARELDSQTEEARSEARELTRRRQEVEREGENLRARPRWPAPLEGDPVHERILERALAPEREFDAKLERWLNDHTK